MAGGAIGALIRAALTEGFPASGEWPWVTLAVNVIGALVLGYAFTRLSSEEPRTERARLFLGAGFCGALTTFSTVQVELLDMVGDGAAGMAVGYAAVSVACGLIASTGGARLASRAGERTR